MFTGEIINLVLDDDKEKELDEALEKLSRVIDEACDKYAQENNLNEKEDMDLPRKNEEPKEKSDDNSIEISVELKNYDEVVEKLGGIKQIFNEISNDDKKVKLSESLIGSVVENDLKDSSVRICAKENHTLDELKQKIINYLYNQKYYESNEIELIKFIFKDYDIKKD